MIKRWRTNGIMFCLAAALAAAGLGSGDRVFASEGTPAANSEQTVLYGIGSTSKMVASAAVMKLAEEGKLSLDEPLVTYLPEFYMADSRYVKITPRMLLDHSSGLQGGTLSNTMLLGDSDTYNHDTILERLRTQRLKADPGEIAAYCNDGFTLAEILVERLSGMTFTEYIQKEFAEPLGLRNFATPQTPGIMERVAPVYDSLTGSGLPPEMANVIGSGGVYATAVDLCKFSRIFMRDQGDAEGILSETSAGEMEKSVYEEKVNPEKVDSTLSYGLGWDSVDTYPYSRYGIRALVKGGDTTFYHASLTVLPEENISCAVLTSGGSSMAAQLAVQEILMEYLEETGRITRTEENPVEKAGGEPSGQIPGEVKQYAGLYAGSELLLASMGEDGTMVLENRGTGRDRRQVYEYGGDGRFYSTDGNYVNFSGGLSRSSNGQLGKTFLEFKTGEDGRDYLMAGSFESYPKLGNTAVYLPVAGRITEKPVEKAVLDAWRKQNEQEFYLVSEKYTSAFYLTHPMVKPRVSEAPAGYLTFDNMALRMSELTGTDRADFFQKIPGQAGRDLNDYRLEHVNGAVYLESADSRYMRADAITALETEEETVTVGDQGEAVWKSFGEEKKNCPVTVKKPPSGAWYVYDHSGKSLKCVSNSWIAEDGKAFLLPAKGYMVFVGEAGDVFNVSFEN